MSVFFKSNTVKSKFYLIIFFLFLWIFLFIPYSGFSQFIAQDTTEYRFWYSSFDARSTAMADANIADPFNLNGLYHNPATLVYSYSVPALISNSLYNSSRNVLLENITTSLTHSRSHRLVGGLTVQGSGIQQVPSLSNSYMQFTQVDLTLGYAWLLSPTLSVGMKVNSIYGRADNSNVWTFNGSLGFLYAPTPSVSYGLLYRGSGLQEGWLGSEPVYHLSADEETTVFSVNVPHRLEMGVTLRFPSLVRYPDFVLSFSNEKIFGLDGLVYKGGLEVNLQDFLSLRGGYFLSPYSEGARLGAGLLLDAFRLDYAFAPTSIDLTGRSHQLSISLYF